MQKKGRGNAKHELTTLQVEISKLGKLSRSPGYGGYCIGGQWKSTRNLINCYNSFTHFYPLIFLVYCLHAPTSFLLFLVYILISFYRLSFLSCAVLLFMHSLMHSMITQAQSCTVCLLMCSLLRRSLVTQYIRTG